MNVNGRSYSDLTTTAMQKALNNLLDAGDNVEEYRMAMHALGIGLGESISKLLREDDTVCVVCTVEDADYMARGFLEAVEKLQPKVKIYFVCFWNYRTSLADDQLQIAPILKRYVEPINEVPIRHVVVLKSIISGACVVRTNLTEVLHTVSPENIFIVSPVMHKDAKVKLQRDFPEDMWQKFQYIFFALDDFRDEQGTIFPGIGGNVYKLLGFEGQEDKNRYRPKILEERYQRMQLPPKL